MSRVFNLSGFVTRNLSGFIVITKEKITKWVTLNRAILLRKIRKMRFEEARTCGEPGWPRARASEAAVRDGLRERAVGDRAAGRHSAACFRFLAGSFPAIKCGSARVRYRISMNKEIITRIRLDANTAQVRGVLTDFASYLRTIPADATELIHSERFSS